MPASTRPNEVIGVDGYSIHRRARMIAKSTLGIRAYYLDSGGYVHSVALRPGYRSSGFGDLAYFRQTLTLTSDIRLLRRAA